MHNCTLERLHHGFGAQLPAQATHRCSSGTDMRLALHRSFVPLLASAALLSAVACERSTSPSSAGAVATSLVSPYTNDGAALIEFIGDVGSVSAPAGTTAYTEQRSAGV